MFWSRCNIEMLPEANNKPSSVSTLRRTIAIYLRVETLVTFRVGIDDIESTPLAPIKDYHRRILLCERVCSYHTISTLPPRYACKSQITNRKSQIIFNYQIPIFSNFIIWNLNFVCDLVLRIWNLHAQHGLAVYFLLLYS